MKTPKSIALFLLRISFGWLFLYAGISKALNPEWTAAGFLGGSQSLEWFYEWFASSSNIGWVNFLNIWGQIMIGLSLLSGTLVRISSFFGIIMMVLYYFPTLDFPYAGAHGYLVDDHVIYALALAVLIKFHAGKYLGVDQILAKKLKLKRWWL